MNSLEDMIRVAHHGHTNPAVPAPLETPYRDDVAAEPPPTYIIDGECPSALAELIAANQDAPLDPEDVAALERLSVGDEHVLGGGAAAAVCVVRRIV